MTSETLKNRYKNYPTFFKIIRFFLPTLIITSYSADRFFKIKIFQKFPFPWLSEEYSFYENSRSQKRSPNRFIKIMYVQRKDVLLKHMQTSVESFNNNSVGLGFVMKSIDHLVYLLGTHGEGPYIVSCNITSLYIYSLNDNKKFCFDLDDDYD